MSDSVYPVIFVLDDDAQVAGALRDDLSRRFGRDFRLTSRPSGRAQEVAAAALFVLIGGEPRTGWLSGEICCDRGYILTGGDLTREHPWRLDRPPVPLETSIPGVFAAGDARYRSIKRVASAVGDGATAVRLAHEYLTAQESSSGLLTGASSTAAGAG